MRWRKFLQPATDQVDSYVAVHIPRSNQDMSIELKINDCTRTVSLWLTTNPYKRKAMVKKLDTLQLALDKVRAAVGPE